MESALASPSSCFDFPFGERVIKMVASSVIRSPTYSPFVSLQRSVVEQLFDALGAQLDRQNAAMTLHEIRKVDIFPVENVLNHEILEREAGVVPPRFHSEL